MGPEDLRGLTREELIVRAEGLAVTGAESMTREELVTAIARHAPSSPPSSGRGWLGRARNLVAAVVERGLHLPDAAKLLRSDAPSPEAPKPLPTVTLAEIYAAQGYHDKAVQVLDEVLARLPEHAEARVLRDRYLAELSPKQRAAYADADASAPADDDASAADAADDVAAGEADTGRIEMGDLDGEQPAPGDDETMRSVADSVPPSLSDAPVVSVEDSPIAAPPDHYAVDEVVALATDPTTAYVYWEVRPVTFARARYRDPDGRLVVRVLAVSVHGVGSEAHTVDVPVARLVADCFVRGLIPDSEIRICIGWQGAAGFVPFAVAPDMKMPLDVHGPPPHSEPFAVQAEPDAVVQAARAHRRPDVPRDEPIEIVAIMPAQSASSSPSDGSPENRPELVEIHRERVRRLYGGASDLFAREEDHYLVRRWPRGRFGGASDLYGGASDLVR